MQRYKVLALVSALLLLASFATALPTISRAYSDEDDNRETILRVINEVFNQGNVNVFDEVTTPDYVTHNPDGSTSDREATKQTILAFRAAMPDLNASADPIIAEDEWVAFRLTITGTFQGDFAMGETTFPPTGGPVTFAANVITHFNEDGLMVEEWAEYDIATFAQQLTMMGDMPGGEMGAGDDAAAPEGEMGAGEGEMGASPGLDGNALVNERCTVCHSRERIDAQDKDEAGWTATVDRMIGNGAQLNAEERQAVIDYLVATH